MLKVGSAVLKATYVTKGNTITALCGPEDSGRLRLTDTVTSALEGGRLSAIRIGRLYPQVYPGTHFWHLNVLGCEPYVSAVFTHGVSWYSFLALESGRLSAIRIGRLYAQVYSGTHLLALEGGKLLALRTGRLYPHEYRGTRF
jgi:hypothetical protein